MVNVTKFDAVDYLDSEEMMAEYLSAAIEDENTDVFRAALADVAKARGIARLAEDMGLGAGKPLQNPFPRRKAVL
jgi:probable addiction module antidote protein